VTSVPAQAGGDVDAGVLRALLGELRPQRGPLALALALGVLAALFSLAQPLATARVIEAVTADEPLLGPLALLVATFLGDALLSALHSFVLERAGEGTVMHIRLGLVHGLLRMPLRELDRRRRGDLLARVGSDTTLIRAVVTSGVFSVVSAALFLTGAVVVMALLDVVLLLIVLAALVAAGGAVLVVSTGIRAGTEDAQAAVARMTAALDRALGAARTVRASRAEDREEARIGEEVRSAYDAGVHVARLDATVEPVANLATQAAFVLVLGVGGARVASGALDVADFVAFLLYVFYVVMPVLLLFDAVTSLNKGLGAYARIRELRESFAGPEPEPGVARPAAPPATGAPALRFESVTFSYRPGEPVLRGVTLAAQARAETAIVGPSGAGKSTLFALAERFYEPNAGRILLGGVDLRALPLGEVRRRIALIEQEAPVLAGTMLENLRYAAPSATDEAVADVLAQLNLDELVARLPDGLDTEVGDEGVLLSGGERQRIAIARALLARPDVLLMDEPAAHLDARNERDLRAAMDAVTGRAALVVIAHRLSTVRTADRIVVLRAGRVEAVGHHEELLARCALYRELAGSVLLDGEPRDAAVPRTAR
jgi:ABC-type multidrug transport system fused ATPase/permease subunit